MENLVEVDMPLEDVRALKNAEQIADAIYKIASHWDEFAKDVVDKQIPRAANSQSYITRLTDIARQLNLYISSLKGQRSGEITVAKTVKESPVEYLVSRLPEDFPNVLFDEIDIAWLESPPPPSIL